MRILISLILLIFLSACATYTTKQDMEKATLKRAAYDLSCTESNIKLTELQLKHYPGTWRWSSDSDHIHEVLYGAEGCNKKMTFQTRDSEGKVEVYREGAAPDPIIINSPPPQPVKHIPYQSSVPMGAYKSVGAPLGSR